MTRRRLEKPRRREHEDARKQRTKDAAKHVRAIDGHGCFSTNKPLASSPMTAGISAPVVASNRAGTQPATGVMAAPGLCGPAPAAIVGAIWMTPVSVCHHVSACVLDALVDGAPRRWRQARQPRP